MDNVPANAHIGTPSTVFNTQTVTFKDQSPAYSYEIDSYPDASFRANSAKNDSLAEFFARPVKTQSFLWNQSVAFYQSFNQWQDFFSNPRVQNRLSNYNVLRCKLHVKVVVNGNGFFYGRLIMNYWPMFNNDALTRDRGLIAQDNIEATQRPHIYIDPTTNQGGEIICPFFWLYDGLSIPSNAWDNMGTMSLRELVQLQHANGATDSVTISVFVHATDVELSVPTAVNLGGISPQMAIDEYGDGLVSKPASAVAKIAGMLTQAPVIGPYARATSMAASTVASIAKMFGYSRPTSVNAIVEMKPTYGGNLANANLPDTSQKLALDAKCEVTIDPRVTGLSNTDELDIVSLAKRESYLTQFTWALTNVAEDLLWNARVTPIQFDIVSGTSPFEIHMTPSCWATLPFKYWRGSMKFRFQIVSSNYHKGRLKIVYDPNFSNAGYNEYNVAYTYIVDIGETKDFTVECGWGNYFPYCTTYSLSGVPLPGVNPNLNFGTTAFPGSENNATNGTISVYVMNDLTVPNTSVTNSVTVNVFTSMSDDFEVIVPTGQYIENYAHFTPQMAVEVTETDKDNTEHPSAPVAMSSDIHFAAPEFSMKDAHELIFAGESIVSFRQLLKRFCLARTYGTKSAAASAGSSIFTYTLPVPYNLRGYGGLSWAFPGETRNSTLTPGTQVPYAYTKMHYLNWILPAYAGMRGAFRHKYVIVTSDTGNNTSPQLFSQVSRSSAIGTGAGSIETPIAPAASDEFPQLASYIAGTSGGGIVQSLVNNNVLEVEHPYYSRDRFIPTKDTVRVAPAGADTHLLTVQFSQAVSSNSYNYILDYISGGEDISAYFFTNCPLTFYVGQTEF